VYCTPQSDIYTLAALVLPKDKGFKTRNLYYTSITTT
jgi:hypothetical protein